MGHVPTNLHHGHQQSEGARRGRATSKLLTLFLSVAGLPPSPSQIRDVRHVREMATMVSKEVWHWQGVA